MSQAYQTIKRLFLEARALPPGERAALLERECGGDRALRAEPLPVIVTTADHSSAVEDRVTAAGAELVHKPIKPAQLRSLLTYMLA